MNGGMITGYLICSEARVNFLKKKWFMNVIEKHDFQKTEAKKIKGRNIYKKGGKKLSEAVG